MEVYRAGIIGGGPAGISTALQLSRYNISHILFEKKTLGGLVKNAHWIENYPGFPQGISGKDLVELLQIHCTQDICLKMEQVNQINFNGDKDCFALDTGDSRYFTEIVVIASGTVPCLPEGFSKLSIGVRERVFFEVYPLLKKREKQILIVGAGDMAFDFALNLAENNRVILLNRSGQVKALPVLLDRIGKSETITYFSPATLISIDRVKENCLSVVVNHDGREKYLEIDYILYAIGRAPCKDFYSPSLIEMQRDLIANNRLFEVGDVKNGLFRQIAISVGNGIEAAMRINQNPVMVKNENNCQNS